MVGRFGTLVCFFSPGLRKLVSLAPVVFLLKKETTTCFY